MIFRYSSQGAQFGRVPGGGLGCLLGLALVVFAGYYALKGLYYVLWWASPALLVLALIINWRVFPDTIKSWLDTLESRPISGLLSAAFVVLAFPFFSLWLFLKALGSRNRQKAREQQSGPAFHNDTEFVDFEEIESHPIPPRPEQEEMPRASKDANSETKAPKEENPYDGFFG